MEQTYAFQTETHQLFELMIHSLYSNKEIFLRELISNASDALDRRRFLGLQQPELLPEDELHVLLEVDPTARTLTLMDNGIGMNRQEVQDNLGTIARSGTRAYLQQAKKSGSELTPELIGQFGVGFYSSFLVAERVEVITRKAGEDTASRWVSRGQEGYAISDAERGAAGTTVILQLKPVDRDDGLEDYTDVETLRRLVRRYSDFVGYPIKMSVERKEPVLGADGKPLEGVLPRLVREVQTLNSQAAIWTRPADEVSDDDYREFYRHLAHDWQEPLSHFATRIEGSFEAQALLFVPTKAPVDLYHRDMLRRGLQLYVKRVFIMDEAKELVPDYLRFLRGVVDAQDLSLNVSREILQQNRQLRAIKNHLVRKTLDHLHALRKDDAERFNTFWREFGPVLKEGLLDDAAPRERLLDLVMAPSTTHEDGLIALSDYVDRLPETQTAIYVLTGPSLETVRRSPHLEAFRERGTEVLLLLDGVDEVWTQLGLEYRGKRFVAVGQGEVDLDTDPSAASSAASAREKLAGEHKDLLSALRAAVQDDVKEVRLSGRLTRSAACLVTDPGGITPQMERLLRASGQPVPKVKRILELNPEHAVWKALVTAFAQGGGAEAVATHARLLHGLAVLTEGGTLEDPSKFASDVAAVMAR